MYKSVKDIAEELTQKQSAPPKERGGPRGAPDPEGRSGGAGSEGWVSHRIPRVLPKADEPNHEKTCSTAPKPVDVWFEGYFYT